MVLMILNDCIYVSKVDNKTPITIFIRAMQCIGINL